jgi:hypothetical protein
MLLTAVLGVPFRQRSGFSSSDFLYCLALLTAAMLAGGGLNEHRSRSALPHRRLTVRTGDFLYVHRVISGCRGLALTRC